MQPIYRWHGTPERTGSLFFVPQVGVNIEEVAEDLAATLRCL